MASVKQFTYGFRALHNINFRLFITAQVISLTGSWMQTTAQGWLVLKMTDSPFKLGLVTTLQFLPVTLLGLYGGVLADRLRKRHALLGTQSAAMIQAAIFSILVATGAIQLWHVYLLAIFQGLIAAVDNPTRQSFVVEMVGKEDLPNAVAINSMTFNMARIIGPSIAGLIIGVVGIAPALIFNAISFIPVLIALLRMDESQLHMAPPIMNNVSVNQRLMEGLSYSRRTPLVLSIFITVAVLGTFGYNFTIMLPLLATYVLHTNAAGFGTLGSFFGVGSVLSAVLTAYRSNVSMRRQLIGAGAFSLILGMLALVNVYALSALLLICLGFASITFATSSNTLLQLYVPDVLRGRIMGVYVLLFVGSTPIGSFIFGTLSDKLGVQVALIICSIICTVGVIGAGLYYYQTAKKKVTIEEPNLL